VEQFYRDNRLNPIHEGTHGIQALDLLGRKVVMRDGAALRLLTREAHKTMAETAALPELQGYALALGKALADLAETTRILGAALARDADGALANASVYLEMFGHTVLAWLWLRQAVAASRGLTSGRAADAGFYRGKLQACRYFFRWELPRTQPQHALLRAMDPTCLEMQDGWF
jgi:butyryl-CoA dehydrogenase